MHTLNFEELGVGIYQGKLWALMKVGLAGTQGVKLIVKATPNERFKPLKVAYYRKEVQPRLYGFAALTVLSILLLVYYIIW